jgi:hypothetical protein
MAKDRISFDRYFMAHLYEMSLEHMCDVRECATCEYLQKRIEKYLGKKEVNAIKRILRKNGYCNKLKK